MSTPNTELNGIFQSDNITSNLYAVNNNQAPNLGQLESLIQQAETNYGNNYDHSLVVSTIALTNSDYVYWTTVGSYNIYINTTALVT